MDMFSMSPRSVQICRKHQSNLFVFISTLLFSLLATANSSEELLVEMVESNGSIVDLYDKIRDSKMTVHIYGFEPTLNIPNMFKFRTEGENQDFYRLVPKAALEKGINMLKYVSAITISNDPPYKQKELIETKVVSCERFAYTISSFLFLDGDARVFEIKLDSGKHVSFMNVPKTEIELIMSEDVCSEKIIQAMTF